MPFVGQLEESGFALCFCACKSSLFVTEQFRLDEGIGDTSTVHTNEGALAPFRMLVNQLGKHSFAHSLTRRREVEESTFATFKAISMIRSIALLRNTMLERWIPLISISESFEIYPLARA